MTGVLQGVRVLELTTMITGPLAGMMLADLGADVIKVENPPNGDPFRTFRGENFSPYFSSYNRNKKSIAVNLRSDKGKEVIVKLIQKADVLIENFRPGVMDRLGLGADVLRELNPRLIVCSISGFGKDGPYRDRPAYDAVAQAMSGITSLFLDPDKPQITGPTIADNMTGIYACYGILGALYERENTGIGRLVEINMVDSVLALIPTPFVSYTMAGIKPDPLMRVKASQAYAMTCSDGKMLAIHMSSQEKFWEAVQLTFGRRDWGDDPRFNTRGGRIDNYKDLAQEMQNEAVKEPREHWLKHLEENDVPHSPINTCEEVFEDPQVRHLGSFGEMEHYSEGTYSIAKRPVWYDGSRDDQPWNEPPELDEHRMEILMDIGYTSDIDTK